METIDTQEGVSVSQLGVCRVNRTLPEIAEIEPERDLPLTSSRRRVALVLILMSRHDRTRERRERQPLRLHRSVADLCTNILKRPMIRPVVQLTLTEKRLIHRAVFR